MDEVRRNSRTKRYSLRTEQAYVGWIRRFTVAHGKRHPRAIGAREVASFLADLAVRGRIAASTQNQALSALLFLYREGLGVELPWMDNIVRAKRPERIRVVLSRDEILAPLGEQVTNIKATRRAMAAQAQKVLDVLRH